MDENGENVDGIILLCENEDARVEHPVGCRSQVTRSQTSGMI